MRGAEAAAAVEASGEIGVAEAGASGRATACAGGLFRVCADVGCDEVSRAKSLPMFRAASQPDKSNNATPTVCVIRPLIIFLSAQRVPKSVEMSYGLIAAPPITSPYTRHKRLNARC